MIPETTVTELHALKQQKADILILDVREPNEYQICQIGGKLIPIQELPNRLGELDKNKKIIVHCRSGGRSRRAVEFLQSQGFTQVSNLTGGIRAWIEQIDPTMTTY